MSAIRVLLADDHVLVRAGLRRLLEQLPGVEVIGEAGDGMEALRLIAQTSPHVVLMDITMPGLNGLEVARRVAKEHPCVRVLIVSMHAEREYVRHAMMAGAAGYLLKSAAPGELELALRAVARGEAWVSPAISRAMIETLVGEVRGKPESGGQGEELTPRQREVLKLLAEGHSTREIARRLDVSAKTVESHRAQIMERLDIHHVAGLVHYALRAGIVLPDT